MVNERAGPLPVVFDLPARVLAELASMPARRTLLKCPSASQRRAWCEHAVSHSLGGSSAKFGQLHKLLAKTHRTADLPRLVKTLHALVNPLAVDSGQFRHGQVRVDGLRPQGFAVANLDYGKRLSNAAVFVDRAHASGKVLTWLFAFSYVHPFSDGNGRTLRASIPIVGKIADGDPDGFWHYFAFECREQRLKLIDALYIALQGESALLMAFYDELAVKFARLSTQN